MMVRGVDYPVTDPAGAGIYVPRPLLPRIAVETGIPASALGDSYLAFRSGNVADVLRPGQYVLHIASADGQGGSYAPFEIDTPTRLVSSSGVVVWLLPVSVDPTAGVWLVRVGTELQAQAAPGWPPTWAPRYSTLGLAGAGPDG